MEYWVWLQSVLRYANGRMSAILDHFGSAKAIYDADETTLIASRLLTSGELKRASDKSLSSVNKIITYCKENNIGIIPYGNAKFPDSLINITDSPLVLYYRGTFPDFNNIPSVCIVGPRKCSDFGIKASYSLSARLARGGMIIVSGGAVGVDAAAHRGALSENAATVALLPCGIDCDYLKENENLREEIIQNGCLISEFPPKYPVKQGAFQIRNRLMSAISLGTVIIEASDKSGALITARHACEQGKDVFVIPGNPTLPQYSGSNRLLRDGAKPLLSAIDVFDEYIGMYNDKLDIEKAFAKPLKPYMVDKGSTVENITHSAKACSHIPRTQSVEDVSPIATALYDSIPDTPFCVDELNVFNDYNAAELMVALAELELFGYIKAVPGGRYVRTK